MRVIALIFLLMVATGCSQMDIYDDYDHDADFTRYQTYRWLERDKSEGVAPLYDKRIRTWVDEHLADKGYRKVTDGDVDLVVSYDAALKERIQMRSEMVYWPGWQPEPDRFQQGTLVIDFADPSINQLVWRGMASGVFDEDPKKVSDQLNKAVDKILKRYPPKN